MPAHQLRQVVAIVGGGASGVLAARSLSRQARPPEIVLIDPKPGRGVAYGGSQPLHLLNTRASNMSLDEDDPEGFLKWLQARGADGRDWTAADFAPRRTFGDYLQDTLDDLVASGAVTLARHRAVNLADEDGRWKVGLDGGEPIQADAILLATGNARPSPLRFPGRDTVNALVIDDPWDEVAIDAIPNEGEVLVVGTGLTAIDVAVTLLHRKGGPRVALTSRRGLLPRIHDRPHTRLPALSRPFPTTARTLYRRVRDLAEAVGGWDVYKRHVIFLGLKPVIPEIWAGLPLVEKQRFARHLRAWWEVERHRLSPEIAAILDQGRQDGRFAAGPGRIVSMEPHREGLARVTLETRGARRTVDVTRIVNCTGPDWRIDRTRDPLLQSVLRQGAAPDSMKLGLCVDVDGEVRRAGGDPLPRLYALGPLTRGAFFEITAVPEIRAKADTLARRIFTDLSERRPTSAEPERVENPAVALS